MYLNMNLCLFTFPYWGIRVSATLKILKSFLIFEGVLIILKSPLNGLILKKNPYKWLNFEYMNSMSLLVCYFQLVFNKNNLCHYSFYRENSGITSWSPVIKKSANLPGWHRLLLFFLLISSLYISAIEVTIG